MPTFELSPPPSVNRMFATRKFGKGRGRIKTSVYRSWIDGELLALIAQKAKPVTPPVSLSFTLPDSMRGDLSNRLKAGEDLLVRAGIIPGDDKRYVRSITMNFHEGKTMLVEVKSTMMPWTDERTEQLKMLYATGLSFSRIAEELGDVSRNACIGRIDRLVVSGAMKKRPELSGTQRTMHLRKRRATVTPSVKEADPVTQAPPSLRISLVDIRDGQCRFIEDDPQVDATYCGHEATHGSYCFAHFARTHDMSATEKYNARVAASRDDRRRP